MKVELYETQLELIDRVVKEGTYGKTREEVLCAAIFEHAKHLLAGEGMFDLTPLIVGEVRKPEYGKMRYDYVMQPVTGKAVPVHKGEVLRIMQIEGGQCVDFNAYNLHDHKEHLSCGMSRLASGLWPKKGDIVWTATPRGRPMYAVLEMPETCKTYIIGHRCNPVYFEMAWGFVPHTNCQDTFAEAIREYGMTPDDTHDSYNLWMNATLDDKGRLRCEWNPARKGDCVDFLSLFDTLAVPIVCGSSDVSGLSNYRHAPVAVQIFSASPSTLEMVNMINGKWGSFKGQQKPEDFRVKDVLVKRELELDHDYKPGYIPVPKIITLDVNITPAEEAVLQSLMKTNQYGTSAVQAIRACLLRWYNATRLKEYCVRLSIH